MADKRQHGLVGFHSDTVIGTRRSCRPSQLQLVLVVLIETADGNTGHKLFFNQDTVDFFGRLRSQ